MIVLKCTNQDTYFSAIQPQLILLGRKICKSRCENVFVLGQHLFKCYSGRIWTNIST